MVTDTEIINSDLHYFFTYTESVLSKTGYVLLPLIPIVSSRVIKKKLLSDLSFKGTVSHYRLYRKREHFREESAIFFENLFYPMEVDFKFRISQYFFW